MGLFNPKLQETSGSSVTQQQAVQTPNVIGAVADVVQDTSSIFSEVSKAKEEGASTGLVTSFTQSLGLIAKRVEQDPNYSSLQGTKDSRALYNSTISQATGAQNITEITKSYKAVNDVTGAFEVEKTPQQLIQEQSLGLATAAGYVNANMTPDQINAGMMAWSTAKLAKTKNQNLAVKYSTASAKSTADALEIKQAAQEESDNNTRTIFNDEGPIVRSNMNSIFMDEKILPEDKVLGIDKIVQDFELELRNGGSQSQDMISIQLPLYKEIAATLKLQITDSANTSYYENKANTLKAKMKLSLLQDNKEFSKLVAISNLMGNSVTLGRFVEPAVGRLLGIELSNKDENNRQINILSAEGGAKYVKELSIIGDKLVTQKEGLENTEEARGEAAALYNSLLLSTQYGANNLKDWVPLSQAVASSGFGDLVKRGLISSEALLEAKNMLKVNFNELLIPRVLDKINTVFTTHSGTFYDNDIIKKGIRQAVDIEIGKDGMVGFVPKAGIEGDTEAKQLVFNKPQYQRLLRELNNGIGKVINRSIKADAHLNGSTDYKAVAEQTLPTYLGERQEVPSETRETPVVTETVTPTAIEAVTSTFEKANIDLSSYEDGIYDHPNGMVMTIKDGVVVGAE